MITITSNLKNALDKFNNLGECDDKTKLEQAEKVISLLNERLAHNPSELDIVKNYLRQRVNGNVSISSEVNITSVPSQAQGVCVIENKTFIETIEILLACNTLLRYLEK